MQLRAVVPAVLLATTLTAQDPFPSLDMSAGVSTAHQGSSLAFSIEGVPGRSFALLFDLGSGPIDVFGERLNLGLGPALFVGWSANLSSLGQSSGVIPVGVRPGLSGLALYAQALILDPNAPNGLFTVSNGAAVGFHGTINAIVESFDDPALTHTGNFDPSSTTRMIGAPIRVRTHRTVRPEGIPFAQGIATPLVHFGSRAQIVYRPIDLGSNGEEELVTAIRWRAFGGAVHADSFDSLTIDLAHTTVIPDYTVDAFSALPSSPTSGLDETFALNPSPLTTVQTYQGPYALQPSDLRADGYVSYPSPQTEFTYNGSDSLLIDLKMVASQTPGSGLNGQIVRLMVPSSPRPNGRVTVSGTGGAPIDPNTVVSGAGDNAMYDYQIEFTRVASVATSQWRVSEIGADYKTPIVMATTPGASSVAVEYRGADDSSGTNATPWSMNVDVADGKLFLQYRVRLTADRTTGEVPSIDSLVIPF